MERFYFQSLVETDFCFDQTIQQSPKPSSNFRHLNLFINFFIVNRIIPGLECLRTSEADVFVPQK